MQSWLVPPPEYFPERVIQRRNGRGGAFPEFKPIGLVKTVKLKKIKCRDRGVPKDSLIESDYEQTIHTHVRLKCPHCPGEVRVRQGPSFHKNRNTMIREHLLECDGFKWMVPPPRKRVKGKPMAGSDRLRQADLPWVTRTRPPQCMDCTEESTASCVSTTDSVQSSTAGVAEWVERMAVAH